MTVNRTTLLDLPLPVTGTESGTWGDTTNNGLTQYMDIAIAGMSNLTSANFTTGALTIETTEGNSSATNITATSGQYAGFRVTSLAQNSTITVGNTGTSPARSYRLINADATYTLTFKATGQTGITLQPGQTAVVAFNGTDYVIVGMAGAGTATDNAVVRFDGTTGKLVQNSVVTIADSTGDISGVGQLNATTVDTTNLEVTNIKAIDGTAAASIANSTGVVSITANPVLSGGTANGVLYLNGSKVATSGSALTFDGANFAASNQIIAGIGVATANVLARSNVSNGGSGFSQFLFGNAITDTRGFLSYSHASEAILFGTSSNEQMRLTSTGLGIGTSSVTNPLTIVSATATTKLSSSTTTNQAYHSVTNASGNMYFGINNSANSFFAAAAYAGIVWHDGAYPIVFGTSNTERMRLDSSGNLSLATGKVTTSTAGTGAGFQWGGTTVTSRLYDDGSGNVYLDVGAGASNATVPLVIRTKGGSVAFNNGTSQTMTLDASGNLVVGTTATAQGRVHAHATANAQFVATDATLGSTYGGVFRGYGVGGLGGYAEIGSLDNGVFTKGIQVQQQATAIAFFTGVNTAGNTERARITSGGDLLVGTTTATGILSIDQRGSAGVGSVTSAFNHFHANTKYADFLWYGTTIGSITNTLGVAVAYNTSSDYRLKDNPQPLTGSGAFIDALKPKTWNWKADGSRGVGFIAHEVQEVSPGSVVGEKDGEQMQAMEYGSAEFIANIIAELQSLRQRVALLEGN